MTVTVFDPAREFVKSRVTVDEYQKLLQAEMAELPSHVPADKRVALAHLLVLEKVVVDPIQKKRAELKREKAQRMFR